LRFTLKPITRDDARAISRWRYDEPYSIYDGDPTSVDTLLQPRFYYHSVYDERGDLTGYFCFGEDAQVAAGKRLGVYEVEPALDLGLGMRPDLTGMGLGEAFVHAGLRFARERPRYPRIREGRLRDRRDLRRCHAGRRKGMAADEMRGLRPTACSRCL
jgi:ribosomal-protein-alanine N-acetyltransferase